MSFLNQVIINHAQCFMLKEELFPTSKKGYIALSGGADSVFLCYLLASLKKTRYLSDLSIVHVNHGTRPQCVAEEEFALKLAQMLELPIHIKRLHLKAGEGNFEKRARDKRYEWMKSFLEAGDLLYLGHHIDDSLEWSLLQQFRSSQVKTCIGIPVRNGAIARPLMAFTAKQIRRFCAKANLAYCIDKSNAELSFERNYIRHQIITPMARRWPSYLKHYVERSTDLVRLLQLDQRKKRPLGLIPCQDILGRVYFLSSIQELGLASYEFIDVIIQKSTQKRGSLREQLKKMKKALANSKLGPISFSGGVKVYLGKNCATFLSCQEVSNIDALDQRMAREAFKQKWATVRSAEILDQYQQLDPKPSDFRHCFPFFFVSLDKDLASFLRPIKRIHPLWPKTTQIFLDLFGYYYSVVDLQNHKQESTNKIPEQITLLYIRG